MDVQDFHSLQEAYMEVYQNLDEQGATSARLAALADKRIGDLGKADFHIRPKGKPSLNVLSNLQNTASRRAKGTYPQQSGISRGEGGAGVPLRALTPVRTSPGDTRRKIARALLDKEANRNKPLTPSERPIPIRSRPTPPSPGSGKTLTPQVRNQRAAASGFKGPGSLPKSDKKYYRQVMTGRADSATSDPIRVLRGAAAAPKPAPKPVAKPAAKGFRFGGGGSSLSNLGSPSGTTGRYRVGGSPGFGISGIRLADEYDLYDIILSHLLDEGYAETPEAAQVIMVNMSEEWRQSILG